MGGTVSFFRGTGKKFWGRNQNERKGINWASWDRLCLLKNVGGLAFSKLHLHDVSLVAKQAWRLLFDDAFFQPKLGWSVWGSLGWTKTTGGLNWRVPDRLGWHVFRLQGRSQADTGLICRSCVVEPLDFCYCWSAGSGCGPLLQEEPEGR